jgi:hypothetical protein
MRISEIDIIRNQALYHIGKESQILYNKMLLKKYKTCHKNV